MSSILRLLCTHVSQHVALTTSGQPGHVHDGFFLVRDRALVFDTDATLFERTCLPEKADKVVGYGVGCTYNGPRFNRVKKYAAIHVEGKSSAR